MLNVNFLRVSLINLIAVLLNFRPFIEALRHPQIKDIADRTWFIAVTNKFVTWLNRALGQPGRQLATVI